MAAYRQRVLVAFGDIEGSLSDIRHFADEADAQDSAVKNARRAADLAQDRYSSGVVSYIEVVDANRDSLSAERADVQLIGRRLIAEVQLIKALGGGWNEKKIYFSTLNRDNASVRTVNNGLRSE